MLLNRRTKSLRSPGDFQPGLFLVPKPKGRNRWEDINLQAPWLFDEYMKHILTDGELRMSFVLEKEWPDWHLIEAVRAETSSP